MSNFHNEHSPHISHVTIRVTSFQKSIQFYEDVIGLQVLHQDKSSVTLASKGVPRITLLQASSAKSNTEGLYHIAFLLSSMDSLSAWLQHNINIGTSFIGASNHEVSHAIYLEDPDGNGIEVYADTPVSSWKISGQSIHMSTLPLDIQALLRRTQAPWNAKEETIVIGHVHLQAKEPSRVAALYQILGMRVTLDFGSALFLSWNNYHHHLAINKWGMYRATDHNGTEPDIDSMDIYYPDSPELLQNQLVSANIPFIVNEGIITITDPIKIKIYIKK